MILKSKRIFLTCMIWGHNGRQPYNDLDMKILLLRRNDTNYLPCKDLDYNEKNNYTMKGVGWLMFPSLCPIKHHNKHT